MMCLIEKVSEIAIVPIASSISGRFVLAKGTHEGIESANKSELGRDVIASQRQGNCVSCNGRNRFQIGRDSGVAMKRVNDKSSAKAAIPLTMVLRRSSFPPRSRAARFIKMNAGQDIAAIESSKMFIHQTLRASEENVERT